MPWHNGGQLVTLLNPQYESAVIVQEFQGCPQWASIMPGFSVTLGFGPITFYPQRLLRMRI